MKIGYYRSDEKAQLTTVKKTRHHKYETPRSRKRPKYLQSEVLFQYQQKEEC